MTIPNRVTLIKKRFEQGLRLRDNWLPMYQLVGQYVMTRKQNFQVSSQPGEFLTEQLFSNTAPEANRTMASAFLGNMWPNGARSVKLVRPRNIPDTKETKKYYQEITSTLTDAMDQPEAGLSRSLDEYFLDQGAFGISGVHTAKTGDLFQPLRYSAENVKHFVIEEDINGNISAVFINKNFLVHQLVDEFGIDNVSKATRDKYEKAEYYDPVRVLWIIEPRKSGRRAFGNKSLPIASMHIEFDQNKILRESGFAQMPVIIGRFQKALGEIYARSPAMYALPAILRLNIIWEMIQRTEEKRMSPPLYLLDNGSLGPAVVDSSANGLSVFNTMGIGDKAPVGQLFDVGDSQGMFQLVEQLMNDVAKAFFIDRLMDLNNETRMTLGEAQIRDRIRGEGLTGAFTRQETELFSPLVKNSANILFEEGLMGVERGSALENKLLEAGLVPTYIPDVILEAMKRGQKIYDIKYVSPARRIMQTEQLQGITQAVDIGIGMAGSGMASALHNYNVDEIIKEISELTGATEKILNDTDTVKQIREAEAQAIKEQQEVAKAQASADVGMKVAQALSMQMGALNGRPKG